MPVRIGIYLYTLVNNMKKPVVVLAVLVARCTLAAKDYMAVVDPFMKEWRRTVRVPDGVLVLRLQQGQLETFSEDGAPLHLGNNEMQGLHDFVRQSGVFPDEAWEPVIPAADWAGVEHARFGSSLQHVRTRIDKDCPVNSENHLERTIVQVFQTLLPYPGEPDTNGYGKMLNIGGFYGGRRGDAPDAPDDPTVELLRARPTSKVLCWQCGEEDPASVTRLGSELGKRVVQAEHVDLLAADLAVPAGYQELDLLRLDHVPAGQSCRVLSKLLRQGVRPRMVAMLVLSQVPLPYKFAPLSLNVDRHPEAFISCSLGMAASIMEPHGLTLLRLTGPYALFVDKRLWPQPLPLNDMACYRAASVWGYEDIPMPFVREWLLQPPDVVVPRLWGNISSIYISSGHPGAPFTLAAA
eukprot:TRINITY_DN45400_c0_g1_i1.p1 TRINITY_DN45400_c0_g1~~TRINITY_DN45400_c0_g1_i1.p1  ORF type:complete len:409 (-),score=42.33 TRINITY_DN45400_c0_g1_i1:190-1416(-)